jgi:peptidoglycan-N-acetylglucosamine deacetylase
MAAVPAGPAAPWPMPVALKASIGLHAAAAGLALAVPQAAPWALGAVVLNHAVLTTAGLWPRSSLLGPNLTHLPADAVARGEIALTIDDGPDAEVTPRVLDLLDLAGARATFFCIAERARALPALTREIVARGHSVQNHSHAHRHNFSLLGPRGMAAEIERAQETLADITGVQPTCFRAPAGMRNPFLDPVLHRLGLRLVSWTRRGFDTRETDPQRVLMRLCDGLARGDILLLHDGHAARSAQGRAVVLDVLPLLLDRCRGDGLRAVTLPAALPVSYRRTAS